MEAQTLVGVLENLRKGNSNEKWISSLSERKLKELEFHNLQRDTKLKADLPQDTYELLHGNKKFYTTVELSRAYCDSWMEKHVVGKVFLDYACGNGNQAILAAKKGAALAIGLDISDTSIRNAQRAAEAAGLASKTIFVQGDCENTGLPADSVDVILCAGMLHHLDLSHAFPEMRRILKPGGRILAVEALNYNPLIKLYRNRTPSMRTEWERNHILSLKDIRFAQRFFNIGEVRYWHMFSILGVIFRNRENLMRKAMTVFNKVDQLLTRIPGFQLMAWQFTFEMEKRKEC